jgi:hypothetical protein
VSTQGSPTSAHRALRTAHLYAAIVCAALAVAMTWPLVFEIDRNVIYPGDPYINTWVLDWDWHATFHHPSHLFDANAFYPARDSLAFSENLYGIALLLFPLRALGVPPLMAHNIAMLLGFAFCSFAAYLLGRRITGCWIAGIAAGIFYAYVPWRFTQLPHLQHVFSGWLPMMIVALLHYADRPTWRRAALFAGAFLMNGLTNIHWLLLGSLAIALTVPIAVRKPRDWARIAVCTLIALTLLTPFLIPYVRVAKLYGMQRSWEEAKHYSATLRDWLNPGTTNRFYVRFVDTKIDPERWLFPGALGIALSVFGLAAACTVRLRRADPSDSARRSRALHVIIAVLWIALGVIGSLGLHTFFHRFLFEHVPGFRAIRVPARWANIGYVGMSMLIALAVSYRRALAYVVAVLFLIELHAAPIRWYSVAPEPPPVYRWLATQKRARIIELPLGFGDFEYLFMFRATVHHRPIVNGMSGFAPPETTKLVDLWTSGHDDELLDELQHIGVNVIVVHADLLGDRGKEIRAWLRHHLDAGRLQFAGRFNASVLGDWAFEIGGPPQPRTADLERFLDDQLTYTSGTFGLLDYPRYGEPVPQNAMFSGWALSPWGIRKVDLLFNNGLVRLPTTLTEDRGLSKGLPWYPQTPRPRFIATFNKRPPGVRPDTDVQVEITDGRGNKTVLEGRPIVWIR